ncbi:hypothetical protein C9413_27460 [Rhizobium sp. SEMIA 4085]|nr:hypothetical protein [Rhizobium gallicum]NNH33038.1 hypothetical protein [Rhizobium sp. SEMIA 4085]
MVTTDGEYFVSSLMLLENFPDGDELELADEHRLVADFDMIAPDHFILAEGTGKVIEVRNGRVTQTADLKTIFTGVHRAIDGRIYAFGFNGSVYQRDGITWRALPKLRSNVLCVRASPAGIVYACGTDGLFASFDGSDWTAFDLSTNVDLQSLLVLDDGSVLLCGMSDFAGVWAAERWVQWDVPSSDYYDLALFKGRIFVGAGSEGLMVVEGSTFKVSKANVFSYSLRASARHLAIAGNNEIVRYDGKSYPCLEFNYDLEDE